MPDGEWEWNDTGVDIICKDCNNKDVKKEIQRDREGSA